VHDLVESVVELLAPRAQAKGLDLTARVTPGVPRVIVADGPRLRQILLNLAGNAVKFTDRGGVGIRIERHGADLRIAVLDTGIGIPEARLPSLFREFDRGSAGEGRDGAGLGLAITHRLVVAMGGVIDVDTAVGKGSSFTATLPDVVPADADEAVSPAQPLQGRRVLVVAPSPFEAPWLVEALADAGAAAALSANLEDARLRIAAERPHAVLVDRAFGPRIGELVAPAAAASVETLLVMLAPAERAELPELETTGFTGWLVKPVRPRTLVARLAPSEAAPAPAHADLLEAPAATAERPLKVLVAEDDEVNALLARTLLARLGHRAERVADGASATAAFAAAAGSDPFDLVLLDLRMPGTDGLAAARQLRDEEARQGLEPAKILALSANAFEEDREAARAAGMDGFLAKPLTAKALTAAIEEVPVARAS
jgi:CheY-like chemotaxis protein